MTPVYKLLTGERCGYGGFYYAPGRRYTFPGSGPLCSSGYAHAYRSPVLAAMMAPIHVTHDTCYEAEADVAIDDGTKLGCRTIIVHEPYPWRQPTTEQRVAFAIACAWPGESDAGWRDWAAGWLTGHDRSEAAAREAARAATARERAAEAAWATAEAAWATARAADAAVALAAAWAATTADAEPSQRINSNALWAMATLGPWMPDSWARGHRLDD